MSEFILAEDYFVDTTFSDNPSLWLDQSVAMQNAMDAAATMGKILLLPNGYIVLENPLVIRQGLRMRGTSKLGTKLIQNSAASGPMFTLDTGPVQEVNIGNFTCLGNFTTGTPTDTHCFHLRGVPSDDEYMHGGLWYAEFYELYIDSFGGKSFWFQGGAVPTPDFAGSAVQHQFLTFRNILVHRADHASSRCFSATGKCGQFYFVGDCEFDGQLSGEGPKHPGLNVCFSREFQTTVDDLTIYGDAGDAFNQETLALHDDWQLTPVEGTPGTDESCYLIDFEAIVQASRHGLWVDRGTVCVRMGYFEQLCRGGLVMGAGTLTLEDCEARDAGGVHEPTSADPEGFVFATRTGTLRYGGNLIIGRADRVYFGEYEAIMVQTKPDVYPPATTEEISVTTETTGGITHDLIDIAGGTSFAVAGGLARNINFIRSFHALGAHVTLRARDAGFGGTLRFYGFDTNIYAPEFDQGRTLNLRTGDSITLLNDSEADAWVVVGRSIAPLTDTAMPTSGYFDTGEFVHNLSAFGSGAQTLGWQRLTSGTAHVAGTDWRAVQITGV